MVSSVRLLLAGRPQAGPLSGLCVFSAGWECPSATRGRREPLRCVAR